MTEITQGSLIYGVRSKKYDDIICYAIVINARCDLAQNKSNKIYYLIALPLKQWIISQIGFSTALNNKANEMSNKIKQCVKSEGLCWEDLQSFSIVDFNKVIDSTSIKIKEKEKIKKDFLLFSHLTDVKLSVQDKKNIIKDHIKSLNSFFIDMSNGKNTNYLLLPSDALKKHSLGNAMIVDLRELDYLDLKQTYALIKNEVDNKNIKLSVADKEAYDEKFFVLEDPGYSIIIDEIDSPWIEYIVQHFANAFTRVGVDNMSKIQIENMIGTIIED